MVTYCYCRNESYHFYVSEVFYLTLEYYSDNFFDKHRINDLS